MSREQTKQKEAKPKQNKVLIRDKGATTRRMRTRNTKTEKNRTKNKAQKDGNEDKKKNKRRR